MENRYRGIRSPHKLKGGVSGCIRECSEAQGKDFGLIATEKGYNVYIGGNGGAKPRHADLLVTNVTEQVAVTYIDRFLMYYIQTADKLQRTARWLEKLPGGIDYLRKVIIDDHLGICEELDKQMSFLVGTYEDEWAKVVNTPALRDRFKANVNGDNKKGKLIEMIEERGQMRPANWPKEVEPLKSLKDEVENKSAVLTWNLAGSTDLFPKDEGRVVNIGDVQIAVFQTLQGKFYATQNMCPVKRDLVLSSGILGQVKQENRVVSYVSCPIHKKNFDIQSGACVSEGSEHLSITTFDVKVEDNQVYLLLPPIAILDEVLGSEKTIIKRSMSPKKIGTPIAAGGSMDW